MIVSFLMPLLLVLEYYHGVYELVVFTQELDSFDKR